MASRFGGVRQIHPRMAKITPASYAQYARGAGGNSQHPHRQSCAPKGSFFSPNGLFPVLLAGAVCLCILISLVSPWTYISQHDTLADGTVCGFRELRSWSHLYCQRTSSSPTCIKYYKGLIPPVSADVPQQFMFTSSMESCRSVDWKTSDSEAGLNNDELQSIYTLPVVFGVIALLCSFVVVIGTVVRAISPESNGKRSLQWHVAAGVGGSGFLLFAVLIFWLAYAPAVAAYFKTAHPHEECIVGPCNKFSGSFTEKNDNGTQRTWYWGPLGWIWAVFGQVLFFVSLYYARLEVQEELLGQMKKSYNPDIELQNAMEI